MLTSSPPATSSDGDPAKDEQIAHAKTSSVEAQKIVRWAILLLDYFILSPLDNLSILLPSALPSTFAFGFPLATFSPHAP